MSTIAAEKPTQLYRLADKIDSNQWAGAFDPLRPVISQGVQANFATRSGPNLTGSVSLWPDRKDNKPHPLLIESGALLAAAAWNGAGSVRTITADSFTWGIDVSVIKYARAQQFGHRYNVRGRQWVLPPRPYLGLRAEYHDKVRDTLGSEIGSQMGMVLNG